MFESFNSCLSPSIVLSMILRFIFSYGLCRKGFKIKYAKAAGKLKNLQNRFFSEEQWPI